MTHSKRPLIYQEELEYYFPNMLVIKNFSFLQYACCYQNNIIMCLYAGGDNITEFRIKEVQA